MRRLRSIACERGTALPIAVVLMTLMLGMGLSAYALVGAQQRDSAAERLRLSTFNLAESVLARQVFILSRNWPGSASNAFPAVCAQDSADPRCPDEVELTDAFDSPDFRAGAEWTTMVRDNGGNSLNFYSDTLTMAEPSWDENGDGRVWVRAQTHVGSKRRTLIGLVRVETVNEQLPRGVVIAGRFATTNQGKKVIVDTQGSAAEPAPLHLRCPVPSPSCADYDPNKGQISPDTVSFGYSSGSALSEDSLDRLRDRAIGIGSYYENGCPANPSGPLVFVENGDCFYNNSTPGPCCNSASEPGVFIVANGTFSMAGNQTFYGLIYGANLQGSSDFVVSLTGTVTVQGVVAVDGQGGFLAGSSKVNVIFDDAFYGDLISYGNAGIVQNTWREIDA